MSVLRLPTTLRSMPDPRRAAQRTRRADAHAPQPNHDQRGV